LGRRNKWNKKLRRLIHTDVDRAVTLLHQGRRKDAERALASVESELRELTPWNGGKAWSSEWDHYRNAFQILRRPCECFFCTLPEAQRLKIKEVVDSKQEDLGSEYADAESNFTGAYAEVVFGFRYNLPINLVRGFDGGKDFTIASSSTLSGTLTIDVKGTVCGRAINGIMRSRFPWIPNWISRDDHIYVLLQVADRQHVFFRGFAFGNDKPTAQVQNEDRITHYVERPGPSRTLEELDALLGY
jgi:hypothetical protein